jgi:Rrf2 family protein
MTHQAQRFGFNGFDADTRAIRDLNRRKTALGSSMRLTRAADYALRVMIHLASLPRGERAMLLDLARATGAPESFLSKVLQSLRRAGFAVSHRGQAGGFEILPAGRVATIADIIQSIEGPVTLNVCLDQQRSCSRRHFCVAHPVWRAAQEAMLVVLREGTIQDLAENARTADR